MDPTAGELFLGFAVLIILSALIYRRLLMTPTNDDLNAVAADIETARATQDAAIVKEIADLAAAVAAGTATVPQETLDRFIAIKTGIEASTANLNADDQT